MFINCQPATEAAENLKYKRYSTVNVSQHRNGVMQLRIFDMQGRVVEQRDAVSPSQVLQVGYNYKPGVYMVEIIQGDRINLLKLVKTH